jgi:DNA-binding transcriptional LysR family regulator
MDFGILYYAIEDYLNDVIGEFSKKYPDINVSVHSYQALALGQDLLSGKIDVGLTQRVSLPDDPFLRIIDICRERMAVIFPNTHRLSRRKQVRVRELAQDTFVFMKNERWHESYIRELLVNDIPGEINVAYTEQIDTIGSTVFSKGAVAIVPGHVGGIQRKNLASALIAEENYALTMSLACRADNNNPAVAVFLKEVCQ